MEVAFYSLFCITRIWVGVDFMHLKKIISFILCLALLCSLVPTAFAATTQSIEVSPINIMVGGKVFLPTDANGKNVPVFVYNGTTYAPLRALAEAYGLTVGYNSEKKLATVEGTPSGDYVGTKGTAQALTKRTTLKVSSINIEVNGKVFQPKDANGKPVSVFVYSGTTYAPLRALAEAYGLTVGYDSTKKLATVDFLAENNAIQPLSATHITIEPEAIGSIEPYKEYYVDSRRIISEDLSQSLGLAYSLTFSDKTEFSELPIGFDPNELLEWGKDPGLNVDILHKYGFTGKGAVIAYIDQAISDHQEFSNVNLHYTNNSNESTASLHGPMVLSLLAGKETGTAPEAEIYYYSIRTGADSQLSEAECLLQIIEQNKKLPDGEKITMVGFSDNIDLNAPYAAEFQAAASACEEAGIMVWFCGEYSTATFLPLSSKNSPENITYNPMYCDHNPQLVYAPASGRTGATNWDGANYIYWGGGGGVSWTMPYVLGLYSIAIEIDPTLTQDDLRKLIVDTAYINSAGMRIVNPVGFVADALKRVGRDAEAKAMLDEVAARSSYIYAVMDTAALSKEDLTAIGDYLAAITDATVLVVDASQFSSAQEVYEAMQQDAEQRGGTVAGVQIFGTPDMVPTFEVQYRVQMKDTVDDAYGIVMTDLFYGNFENDVELIGSDYNVLDHFAENWNVDLIPQWPVARLPLSKGEFTAFFEKYEQFALDTGLEQLDLVNFSNPIFAQKTHSDDMSVFLKRMDREFGILNAEYRLYANQEGDYPVAESVLGGFTHDNLSKENANAPVELLINSHGQWNNIDQCIFENGEEVRVSFLNMDNINTILDDEPYYLDTWTCLNGYRMKNNLTTTALNGQCVGMFSSTNVISSNGANCRAGVEEMQESNFYYFYYTYLEALDDGLTRSQAFCVAQQAYGQALIEHSKQGLQWANNYQFNLYNLFTYHNFGVLEPNAAAMAYTDPKGYIAQAGQSVPKQPTQSQGGGGQVSVKPLTTEGKPVEDSREVAYTKSGAALKAGDVVIHSLTVQRLDNNYVRITMEYTVPADTRICVFNPPNGDVFKLFGSNATGEGNESMVFDLSLEDIATITSVNVNFYTSDQDRCFVFFDSNNLK